MLATIMGTITSTIMAGMGWTWEDALTWSLGVLVAGIVFLAIMLTAALNSTDGRGLRLLVGGAWAGGVIAVGSILGAALSALMLAIS